MRSEIEISAALDRYSDTVRRLCMVHLKNEADTEDIFQTVFLKYVLHSAPFESESHKKAWLIRVTLNACRDLIKSFFRSHSAPLDEARQLAAEVPSEPRGAPHSGRAGHEGKVRPAEGRGAGRGRRVKPRRRPAARLPWNSD